MSLGFILLKVYVIKIILVYFVSCVFLFVKQCNIQNYFIVIGSQKLTERKFGKFCGKSFRLKGSRPTRVDVQQTAGLRWLLPRRTDL